MIELRAFELCDGIKPIFYNKRRGGERERGVCKAEQLLIYH
jgi:hypothetical protein